MLDADLRFRGFFVSDFALLLKLGLGDLVRVEPGSAPLLARALGVGPQDAIPALADDEALRAVGLETADEGVACASLARLLGLDALSVEDPHARRTRLRMVLQTALVPSDDSSARWRHLWARFRLRLGMVELFAGEIRAARALAAPVMDEAEARADAALIRAAAWVLIPCLRESGDVEGALALTQRWVGLVPAHSSEEVPAWFALATGWQACGDRVQAEQWFARTLARCAEVGSPRYEALCLSNLGHLAEQGGALDVAYVWFEQVIARCPDEDLWLRARTLAVLGHLGAVLNRAEAVSWMERAEQTLPTRREPGIDIRLLLGRATLAADRADRDTVQVLLQRLTSLVSHEPSPQSAAWIQARMAEVHDRLAGRQTAVRVHTEGQWFRLPGQSAVDVSRFPAQTRILAELVRAARDGEGRDIHALFEAGWPGQRSVGTSSHDRVYTAVRLLRRAGLAGTLVQGDGQYRLENIVDDETPFALLTSPLGTVAAG